MQRTLLSGLALSFGAGGSVFVILLYASAFLPATWDEGEFTRRADAVTVNIQKITGTNTSEGHPQFPVLLSALGHRITGAANRIQDYRYGIIVFFSFTAGCVFYRLKKDFDTATAVFGILSLLLIPRLFAHCQIAAWDSVLTASWLLCYSVPCGTQKKRYGLLTGFCLGLTIASKFSGLAVLIPFYLFNAEQWRKRKTDVRSIFVTFLLVHLSLFLTFIAFNPPIWNQPFSGTFQWFSLNLHRNINVATLFFGTMYDLYHSLPWYNTLVWTAITVPTGILLCFFFGLAFLWKNKDKRTAGLWLVLNMLPLLVIRALPGTPVHDGERMFLPAFAFLGIIAGSGAAAVWRKRFRYRIAVVLIYLGTSLNLYGYAPQWLSYYNGLIGGLPGAVRCGMEPTYWWDGFDREVIDWLYANSQDGDGIAFSIGSVRSLELSVLSLKFNGKTDDVRRKLAVIAPKTTLEELQSQGFRYYVLQCRPSAVFPRDEELQERRTPVYVKSISGVPLLKIYEMGKR